MPEFVTSDGLQLYYEDAGNGPPLLCLAGLTRNSRDFDFLAPHLPDARLVRMDYRGRGKSQHDPNYANYNVLREAQDATELLDHLGLARVTVLGTSRGGLIAMMMAAGTPDRLAGVILNDVGPVVGAAGLARIMQYVGKKPVVRTYDEAAARMQEMMQTEFPGLPKAIWRNQAEAQFLETGDGLELRYDPHLRTALVEQAEAEPPPDLWPLFEALKPLPSAVLRGANSDILTHETLAEMQARHPGLITAEIADRGHVPFLDEPDCLTVIRRILATAA